MKKILFSTLSCVLFFLLIISYNNLFSEVVWGDPNKPNGIGEYHWNKYKDICQKKIAEKYKSYPGKLPKSFLNHEIPRCIAKEMGIKFKNKKKRGGWHPLESQTRNGKPYVDPWDPKNPRKFNAYQYCLGQNKTSCNKDCDNWKKTPSFKSKDYCLVVQYQCQEFVNKCVASYRYWTRGVEKCWPDFYWDYKDDRTYQWLVPDAIMGKGAKVTACLAPLALRLDAWTQCNSFQRCKKVCMVDRSTIPYDNIKEMTFEKPEACIKTCKKHLLGYQKRHQYRKFKKCPLPVDKYFP